MSHLDLNMTNIIVKDDKIEAIIDWEMAGYYPWWAEPYSHVHFGGMAELEFSKAPLVSGPESTQTCREKARPSSVSWTR